MVDKRVIFKLAAKPALPTFNEGSEYVILNCATGKVLVLLSGYCPGRDLYLCQYSPPISNPAGTTAPNTVLVCLSQNLQSMSYNFILQFTLKVQADGGVSIYNTNLKKWAGSNFAACSTECSFYFIGSETNKDWFL